MEKYLILERNIHGNGHQRVYKFENGYGASVVKHGFSYGGDKGLWELAVLSDIEKSGENVTFSLCYHTSITDDVLGHLSDEDVENTLKQIKDL